TQKQCVALFGDHCSSGGTPSALLWVTCPGGANKPWQPHRDSGWLSLCTQPHSSPCSSFLPECTTPCPCCLTTTSLLTPSSSLQSFQGSQGRAYLFNSVVNVGCGPAEERVLLTGLHAVADIYCENCKTTLGWKYEHAFESSQKYKEGKFIIELAHMIKDNGWE
ncbi:PREDICTED: protein yippee-like 1, partial [Galeopterus variegatus]|uniref:Protein yippee-like n=1 Tax=Galeopterus variegatus TaxID=482537 RepID=A0ABM0Q2V8_GALVR